MDLFDCGALNYTDQRNNKCSFPAVENISAQNENNHIPKNLQ